MKKINWKVRFSKDNLTFILRFIGRRCIVVIEVIDYAFPAEDL